MMFRQFWTFQPIGEDTHALSTHMQVFWLLPLANAVCLGLRPFHPLRQNGDSCPRTPGLLHVSMPTHTGKHSYFPKLHIGRYSGSWYRY